MQLESIMAELQAQAEASAGFETTTVAAVATGPALFAAADAMLQEQELNDILAPYERDAAILLDILLQDPTVREGVAAPLLYHQ